MELYDLTIILVCNNYFVTAPYILFEAPYYSHVAGADAERQNEEEESARRREASAGTVTRGIQGF